MKKILKFTSLILCASLMAMFCGCSKNSEIEEQCKEIIKNYKKSTENSISEEDNKKIKESKRILLACFLYNL